jgi:tRNA (mo5U34)-methyltransferase
MAEIRSLLQQALNEMVSVRTDEERRLAGDTLIRTVQEYLQSGEVLGETPDVTRVVQSTIDALGGRVTPASTLSDADVETFNNLLPWASMTADPHGRIVGRPWNAAKRFAVHGLVDTRQLEFNDAFNLNGRHVLELGCFEGIHTIGLLLLGASVTAVDGRIENVLKTLARVWMYGMKCDVAKWDFEEAPSELLPDRWDVLHHIGVLYHLSDPIRHLNAVLPRTTKAVLLDTHVADSADVATLEYVVDGAKVRYRRKPEPHAVSSPFAGMRDHAKYLVVDDLIEHLRAHGFEDTKIVSNRLERNGRRVTIWAFRGS